MTIATASIPSGRAAPRRPPSPRSCHRSGPARARAPRRTPWRGRVDRQRPGDKHVIVVHPRRDAMNGADERALARRRPCRAGSAVPAPAPLPAASRLRCHRSALLAETEEPLHLGGIRPAAGEIVESLVGHPDQVAVDERRAFRSALLGMFEAAFPFQYRPAGIIMGRKPREHARKSTCPSPSERNRPARLSQGW